MSTSLLQTCRGYEVGHRRSTKPVWCVEEEKKKKEEEQGG